jgi:hypothetical protein
LRLLGLCALAGALLGVAPAAAQEVSTGAPGYSAYADPEKTAIAVILSEEENVREFREAFGLDDGEVGEVLSAVREENGKVAEEFAQSEKIVAANNSLPDGKVADKIAASDYEETVERAIEETKDSVAETLPDDGEAELQSWVDAQWRDEVAEASEGGSGRVVETKAGRVLVCDRIYATQYRGYTRFEAALPHRALKFGSRPEVPIIRGNRSIRPRIKEVGPWNTKDNWWRSGKKRAMWKGLRRCVPEARAAYFNNYNRGRDEYRRKVTNPAGVDLTPRAARRLGLKLYQNAYVSVRFPWVGR